VLAVLEEHPREYIHRAQGLGFPLRKMIKKRMLEVMSLRPLDLSPDETLFEIREAAERAKAKRVDIDPMSGLEMALAPTFRTAFRESPYRLIGALIRIRKKNGPHTESTESTEFSRAVSSALRSNA
jgi:circadian clock protein KaiC